MTSNFLHYVGGASPGPYGFLVQPFEFFNQTDAAFDTLTNTSAVTSANAGTSGKFDQTNFASAMYGLIWFIVGDTGWTPTAGAVISCWFLHSPDGGSTFEDTVPARPPDFYFSLQASAYSAGDIIYASGAGPGGVVELPWDVCKIYAQNNTGATMGNTSTTHAKMYCGPVADLY